MAHKVLMPALSPTMTEGKLAKWVKQEGDTIESGDVIAEIETDKATMEVEAVDEGVLAKIVVPEGTDGVAVNSLIAVLLEDGEDESALELVASNGNAPPSVSSDAKTEEATPKQEAAPQKPVASAAPQPSSGSDGRVIASPLARRIAKEKGIDLSTIKGSGPRGRIVKADVLNAKPGAVSGTTAASSAAASKPSVGTGPDARALADAYGIPYELVPNSGVRKVIARRLSESKQTVPHFYLDIDIELDALLKLRKQINTAADGLYKISVNDFVIKATALALKKFPAVNVSWTDDAVVQYTREDVSVAVATDNGLITPIIKDAANKSLKDISIEMKELAGKARDGKLKPEEFQGGTISVSNLGMFGTKNFKAIVNPPQGAILAVGAGEQRPVVREGDIVAATVMTATLSVDHRCIDGAVGAEYLQVLKGLIESPMSLIL